MAVTLAPSSSPTSPAPHPLGEGEAPFDWSLWELDEEEDMGHSPEHHRIMSEVESILKEWVTERGWTDAFVCSDTFFAWVPERPNVRVSPDAYLLWGAPRPLPASWQTWRAGHPPPAFALEVVSEDRIKEYAVNPAKYDALGATELVIYDPEGVGAKASGPITHYRRGDHGRLELATSNATLTYSHVLEAWLLEVMGPEGPSLRLSRDPQGRSLVPTSTERADFMAADAENQRAEKEKERALRLALEAESAALRAELARVLSSKGP